MVTTALWNGATAHRPLSANRASRPAAAASKKSAPKKPAPRKPKKQVSEQAATVHTAVVQHVGGGAAHVVVTHRATKIVCTMARVTKQSPPICFVVAIDTSYSMRGMRLEEALAGIRTLVNAVRERRHAKDLIKLITFNQNHTTLQEYTQVQALDMSLLEAQLSAVTASGGTAIYDTLQHMHDDLDVTKASHRGRMTEFILLTDGDDQHSSRGGSIEASARAAKSRLATPGCPNFNLSLLFVGDCSTGMSRLSAFAEGPEHFHMKPCSDSPEAIRRCFTSVIKQVTERIVRVETEMRRTTSTTTGDGFGMRMQFGGARGPIPCRFGGGCRNRSCTFTHPPRPCRFGGGCTNQSCTFAHPDR